MEVKNFDDLNTLELILDSAVCNEFMSRQHAKEIWKEVLKKSGLDVPRPIMVKKEEVKKV
jgi:hypothetical protein